MYYSDQYKFCFMHINKTGGRSLTKFLIDHVPDLKSHGAGAIHKSYNWIMNSNLIPEDYRVITIVRNPWERYESLYRYRKMKYATGVKDNGTQNIDADQKTFDEWFWYQLGSYDYLDRPQVDWLPDDFDKREKVFFLRLEHIESDVPKMFNTFEIEVDEKKVHTYPHINKSPAEEITWKPESFLALNIKEEYIVNRFYRGVKL